VIKTAIEFIRFCLRVLRRNFIMNQVQKCLVVMMPVIALFTFVSISGTTDVPNTLNYQGTLTDNTGQPVTGSHQIIFNLYDVPSGGSSFWSETQTVQVTNGRFSVALGKTTSLDTTKFTGTTYIGIKVDSGTEMAPRQQLTSVAYALKAGSIFNMPETIPQGLIAMWSGAANQIPAGWALCDGTKGTPDLRDRFIAGAGNTYAVGTTGGEATHTLTIDEMPSHTHIQNAHTHYYSSDQLSKTNGSATMQSTSDYPASNNRLTSQTTATNQNTGGGAAHNNLPPYYALAFIMKL
jgi:microcystin-dependent protein